LVGRRLHHDEREAEDQARGPDGFEDPVEGDFIVVDFTVENLGNESMSVSDVGLYAYDAETMSSRPSPMSPSGTSPRPKISSCSTSSTPGYPKTSGSSSPFRQTPEASR
jgi:hypothetical protein